MTDSVPAEAIDAASALSALETHPARRPVRSFRDWLSRMVRWREWADGKQGLIHAFAWLSVLLTTQDPVVWTTIAAVCLSGLALMWAYLLNASADRVEDEAAGKVQPFAMLPNSWQVVVLVGLPALLLLGAIGLGLGTIRTIGLGGIIVCGFLYSYRLVGLKTHRVAGPLLATVGQRNWPLVLVTGWLPWSGALEGTAHGLCFLVGLRWILVHYLVDHEADVRTGTPTLTTRIGEGGTRRLLRLVFLLERLALIGVVVAAATQDWSIWVAVGAWVLLHVPLVGFWWRWPLHARLHLTAFAPLHDFYHAVLPVVLIWTLTARMPQVLPVAVVESLLAAKFVRYYWNLYGAANVLPPLFRTTGATSKEI